MAVLKLITRRVLGRRLHWQVGRLLAFEDAIDVTGRALVLVDRIRPIGGEAPNRGIISERVDVRQAVPRRQRNDQVAMSDRRRACCHDQAAIPLTRECSDGVDLAGVAHVNRSQLHPDSRRVLREPVRRREFIALLGGVAVAWPRATYLRLRARAEAAEAHCS